MSAGGGGGGGGEGRAGGRGGDGEHEAEPRAGEGRNPVVAAMLQQLKRRPPRDAARRRGHGGAGLRPQATPHAHRGREGGEASPASARQPGIRPANHPPPPGEQIPHLFIIF
jgi:hypothetical protein